MTQLAIHRQSGQGKEWDIAPDSNTQTLDPQDPPTTPQTACAQSQPLEESLPTQSPSK